MTHSPCREEGEANHTSLKGSIFQKTKKIGHAYESGNKNIISEQQKKTTKKWGRFATITHRGKKGGGIKRYTAGQAKRSRAESSNDGKKSRKG